MDKEFFETGEKENNLMRISQITLENGKRYYFFSDGNLYEKSSDGVMNKLDKNKNKELVDKIMKRFVPPKIDVIREEKNVRKKSQKTIYADLPEL